MNLVNRLQRALSRRQPPAALPPIKRHSLTQAEAPALAPRNSADSESAPARPPRSSDYRNLNEYTELHQQQLQQPEPSPSSSRTGNDYVDLDVLTTTLVRSRLEPPPVPPRAWEVVEPQEPPPIPERHTNEYIDAQRILELHVSAAARPVPETQRYNPHPRDIRYEDDPDDDLTDLTEIWAEYRRSRGSRDSQPPNNTATTTTTENLYVNPQDLQPQPLSPEVPLRVQSSTVQTQRPDSRRSEFDQNPAFSDWADLHQIQRRQSANSSASRPQDTAADTARHSLQHRRRAGNFSNDSVDFVVPKQQLPPRSVRPSSSRAAVAYPSAAPRAAMEPDEDEELLFLDFVEADIYRPVADAFPDEPQRAEQSTQTDSAEEFEQLNLLTPRFSRACPICFEPHPATRVVLIACGHSSCHACAKKLADTDRKLICHFCRAHTGYVRLFEELESPSAF